MGRRLVLLPVLVLLVGPGRAQEAAPSRPPAQSAQASEPTEGSGRTFDPLQKVYRRNRQGNRSFEQGDLEAALRDYAEAQGLAPDDPRLLYNMGNVLAGQGKAEEALRAFERAAGATDRTVARDARFNEGLLRMGQEDFEGAVGSFGRSLVLDPTDAEARRNLELALRRLQEQQQQQQQQQQDQQDEQDQEQNEEQKQQQQQQEQQQEQQEQQQEQEQEQEPRDEETEAARRLLKALEEEEKEALKKALMEKLPDLKDREKDW